MNLQHDTATRAARGTDLSLEQRGLIVAALTAFFGIAYGGPALTRLFRKSTPRERLARKVGKIRPERARTHDGRRPRRLGGGTFHG